MQESGRLVLLKACWLGGLADVSLSSKTGNWSAGADLPPKKTQRAITTASIKVVEKNVTAFCASHLPAFFAGAGSSCWGLSESGSSGVRSVSCGSSTCEVEVPAPIS